MKIVKNALLFIFIGLLISACNSNETNSNTDTELEIYTSIYPIQYAVERIAGDSASVQTVYPPGVDAHTYEPTSKDITDIAESDAFIYMGAGMEGFAETAADALTNQEVLLVELGKHEELFHTDAESQEETDHAHDGEDSHHHGGHSHGDHDPHIWIDPLRMLEMAALIKEELIALHPEMESAFNENFSELETDLIELDESYQETLNPKKEKKILVSHAGYGYWEERYGMEQLAINGLSSSSEPSQQELTEIVDQAREYDMDYIIFEQNTSDRVTEIIQNEIGAEALTIHNLSVLTDQDLENNEDYLSLMERNLEVLDQATE